jgi:hypothetical protein
MKVNNETLHTPLLGDELIDKDEETLSQVAHDEQDDDNDDNKRLFGACEILCMDLVLLLSIQCQMTWCMVKTAPIAHESTSTGVPYSLQFVTMSIATFGISAWLFRLSCLDCPMNVKNHFMFQNIVLILPELLTNIVIIILFILGKIGATLVALRCGSLLLSVLGLGMTVHLLLTKHWRDEQEEAEEQMESRQVGILSV